VALADALRRRGAVEEAEATLRGCLQEHPGFLAAVDPYAAALLRRGVPAPEVVATVHALVADCTPSVRFLLAVALSEAGAVAEAESELRGVLEAQPANAHARVALAETVLAQGRFADAAAIAAAVDAEAPCAAAAQRTELFARLTDGTPADAHGALALPDEERAVFASWQAVCSGATAPAGLPSAAAAPILIMLDALARLQAFDAFADLVAVLETVAIPWRRCREALADLYLRHGYADSAAEEWLAICERDGIDAAALRGMAAVAIARGFDEDAQVFAAEAEALAAS
jgi:tetratricopeptide (TPR) repeat protein